MALPQGSVVIPLGKTWLYCCAKSSVCATHVTAIDPRRLEYLNSYDDAGRSAVGFALRRRPRYVWQLGYLAGSSTKRERLDQHVRVFPFATANGL
jgi:hypothetical protein